MQTEQVTQTLKQTLESIKFDQNGLVTVVVQSFKTNEVLMVAWANEQAIVETLKTGYMHYYSRSRQKLWRKGETSGNIQRLVCLLKDCDADTLLAQVEQTGAACHTGQRTCFFQSLTTDQPTEKTP